MGHLSFYISIHLKETAESSKPVGLTSEPLSVLSPNNNNKSNHTERKQLSLRALYHYLEAQVH